MLQNLTTPRIDLLFGVLRVESVERCSESNYLTRAKNDYRRNSRTSRERKKLDVHTLPNFHL